MTLNFRKIEQGSTITFFNDINIRSALQLLDKGGIGTLLYTDEHYRLLGLLTDGDLRRAIINGVSLDESVLPLVNFNALKVLDSAEKKIVLDVFKHNVIRLLPVVDSEDTLVGLYIIDDFVSPLSTGTCMVFMAGGRGERMYPLTEDTPKPMLKIKGEPIIERAMKKASKYDVTNFIIMANYLSSTFENYFANYPSKWKIEIVKEKKRLGTAGALKMLENRKDLGNFFVCNADVLSDVDLEGMMASHLASNSSGTMGVINHVITNPYGVVEARGSEYLGFDEKPKYRCLINSGIYILNQQILKCIPDDRLYDMPTLFEDARSRGERMSIHLIQDNWIDIGNPNDLEKAKTLDWV